MAGTTAGNFDALNVGGGATLAGTLAMAPSTASPDYTTLAALGDSVGVLTCAGTRSGSFTAITSNPALAGGKTFGAIYDDVHGHVNAVVGHPPSNTVLPAITGTTMQAHALSVTNGTWSGSPTAFTYAWKDCDLGGTSCTDIAGRPRQRIC